MKKIITSSYGELYFGTVAATRNLPSNRIQPNGSAVVIFANSADEAHAAFSSQAMAVYPVMDGWYSHSIACKRLELPEKASIEIEIV